DTGAPGVTELEVTGAVTSTWTRGALTESVLIETGALVNFTNADGNLTLEIDVELELGTTLDIGGTLSTAGASAVDFITGGAGARTVSFGNISYGHDLSFGGTDTAAQTITVTGNVT